MSKAPPLEDRDYVLLAEFRFALRRFLAFSENEAGLHGLTPQQHQALLAIRGAEAGPVTIGYLARRLLLKPHSATGLVDRLEGLGLLQRAISAADRRQAELRLTPRANDLLEQLSTAHREELTRLQPVLSVLLDELA